MHEQSEARKGVKGGEKRGREKQVKKGRIRNWKGLKERKRTTGKIKVDKQE